MSVRRLAAAVFASMLFLASQTAHAATLDVDDDRAQQPSAPWTSIDQAIGVAQRGDTVRVFPGTYNEQVVIDKDINLIAYPLIGEPVIIQPLALPESRLSVLQYTVPVTAGILVDGATVIVEGFQLDMSQSGMATCSPLLTGVYMRNASGSVRRMMISGASIPADPTCDSGVAVYVESGKAGEIFGKPFFGAAHVRLIENTYLGYQKAGMVANGRYTVVSDRGDQALGLGPTGGAVQYGFQVGASAKGRFRKIMARDHSSTVTDRTAAGLLVYRTSRARLGQAQFLDSQTGMFVVGDHAAVFTTGFQNMSDDGIVFLGDVNLSQNSNITGIGDSGVFINGYRNAVRSGFISDMLVGVWIYRGLLNRFGGIHYMNVPIAKQGVYGGDRNLDVTHVVPVMACGVDADCDDQNACTYDLCDQERALCHYVNVVCEDFNPCTDDSCDVTLGCQNVANTNPCDDHSVCTTGDVCSGGMCLGTSVVCDDLNTCTTDTCDATLGCQFTPVTDGTACGVAMTCTAGVCS